MGAVGPVLVGASRRALGRMGDGGVCGVAYPGMLFWVCEDSAGSGVGTRGLVCVEHGMVLWVHEIDL